MTVAYLDDEAGELSCVCSCGKEFRAPVFSGDPHDRWLQETAGTFLLCPECLESSNRLALVAHNERMSELAAAEVQRLIEAVNVPENFSGLEKAPVRPVAVWIWENRDRNLLLKGPTGAGKTTSAVFVAEQYARRRALIRYTTLRELIVRWVELKKDDKPAMATDRFLREIGGLDVLIIDEAVNKCVVSLAGQEILFELIDGVYSGRTSVRLWILGNFEAGSIENIFADSAPVYRRIRESFLCGEIVDGCVKELKV